MKEYFIDLDYFGKDTLTITLENVSNIEKLNGYYSVLVNDIKITYDIPIKRIYELNYDGSENTIW